MLTAFNPLRSARRERHWAGKHFGSVRIAQKDQKSIRINPTRKISLARALQGPPHRPFARPMLLERADVYAGVQAYPLFTMSRNPRASSAAEWVLSAW